MPILAATPDALYRVVDDGTERVLDAGVRQVRTAGRTVYAATSGGLRESTDGGRSWTDTGLDADVHSVAVGDDVFAGARPLSVHRLVDGDWTELPGLRDLAAREDWPSPSFRDEAWARSVAVDGDRVLVGVEVGGLAVRSPGGTWRSVGPVEDDPDAPQRRDDVHYVAVRAPGEWLLATGAGVFLTTDAGGSWTRLDTGERRYAREVWVGDGDIRVGVNDSPPRWRPPDAALYAGEPPVLSPVTCPGEPERFLISWAVGGGGASGGGALFAGANDGAILRFADGDAEKVAEVPVSDDAAAAYGVRSLAVV